MRLLLIEDEPQLAALIAAHLRLAGFVVDVAHSLSNADEFVTQAGFDAILLDRGLPDGDGLQFLLALRNKGVCTPVLVLTAQDAVEARVKGLDCGADDYLVKPFALAEMLARVRALLRRPGGVMGQKLSIENLSFDTVERVVQIGSLPVSLTRHELAALECLMRRAGRVVTRETLVDQIYGFDTEPASNAVPVHIHNLRKRLMTEQANVTIVTFRGLGYLLRAEGAV